MLIASNKGAGMNFGMPDVCLTPPLGVPVPYPNIGLNAQAAPFALTVMISGMNALNLTSMIPMTSGDEAGSMSPIKGPGRYTMGNPVVNIEGVPGICLLCPTTGNNMINPIGAVLVPSVSNVFFTCAAPGRVLERESVSAKLEGRVLNIAIRAFLGGVSGQVHSAVERFAGCFDSLSIDLRGNAGGELHAFLDLAGDFLPAGTVIARTVDPDGDETVHRSRRDRPYAVPLVVLVDRSTASAAELFAGAMKLHDRAVLRGERTYGKATVHLATRGAGYPEVAECLLADGTSIQGVGVEPHVFEPCDETDPRMIDLAKPLQEDQ